MERRHYNFISTFFIAAVFSIAATSSAAPKWKKVNVNTGSSSSSAEGQGFSCVSSIAARKIIPPAASGSLAGVKITYSMVGAGGGSSSGVAGLNGAIVSGSFVVQANTHYDFIVGQGGGAGPAGGGGGSSAIVINSVPLAIANGGNGATYSTFTAGGGSNTGGLASNSNVGGGNGGVGFCGGGSRSVSGTCTALGQLSWSGTFGSGGHADGSGKVGESASLWALLSSPILPPLAGMGGAAGQNGGNAGAIVLSYTGPSCIF